MFIIFFSKEKNVLLKYFTLKINVQAKKVLIDIQQKSLLNN